MALATFKTHFNMRGTVFTALVMVMSLFCLGKSIISVIFEKCFIVKYFKWIFVNLCLYYYILSRTDVINSICIFNGI